jgi:hypothetical protein
MATFLKALLGSDIRFEFPRLWFTKGQTLKEYVFGNGRAEADWSNTRSCWQDNRHVSVNGHRRQCGICAACMLRRLSVHAAGLSESGDTYIWESLRAKSFEDGAASGFEKIGAQRDYAIAGALHLDLLAGLRRSPLHAHAINLNASQLARSLREPERDVRGKLDRLLTQHGKEWKDFMGSLGPDSFVAHWVGQSL